MSRTVLLVIALASLGVALCAAAAERPEGVAKTQFRPADRPAPTYEEPKMSYYPSKKAHPGPSGYEYRIDADQWDGYHSHGGDYYQHAPRPSEHHYESQYNELTPTGDVPHHLKLRLFGIPVGHTVNMSMATGLQDGEVGVRHAPVMKMYDMRCDVIDVVPGPDTFVRQRLCYATYNMWCDVPHDPAYDEAVSVPHLGHFHVTYKPAHHQTPWRLWGQTALRIGKITEFSLAHLDDDNDQSACATFFNNNTIITLLGNTPSDNTPIYNMLIKPSYPVNMQYVLDDMRAYPIPAQAVAYSVETSSNNGDTSYTAQAANYDSKTAKSEPTKVMFEEGVDCKVAQVIWGRVRISTIVKGKSYLYEGTIRAVPDLDDTGVMPMFMPMRRADSSTHKIIEAMCGDEVVKEAVPWTWEFNLKRV